MQDVFAAILVISAAVFLVLRLVRRERGGACGGGCGCAVGGSRRDDNLGKRREVIQVSIGDRPHGP